jgi:uncharacterized membrane protein YgcG
MNLAKKFVTLTLIIAGIGLLFTVLYFIKGRANLSHEARSNTECLTSQRVFDYADKLSNQEESQLLSSITELEDYAGIDVAIFTLDNSTDLSEQGLNNYYDIQLAAEGLCDYYRFGWEEWPVGTYLDGRDASSSIVIVANWDTGDAWMCTSGKCKDKISNSKASDIVQYGCNVLRDDPLSGFQRMLTKTKKAMRSGSGGITLCSPLVAFGISLVLSIIFFAINFSKKAGKDTTNQATYSVGNAQLLDRRDIFIRKEVHSVKIQTNSGGGGGGGGGFSGGGGHGGGGGHF